MVSQRRTVLNAALILLTVFSLDSSAQTRPAKAADQTWSDYLQFIEKNQPEKDRILHSEMQITNTNYDQSKNKKMIESTIRARWDGKTILQTATLKSGETLKLIDNGLGKSIDLVRIGLDSTTSTVIYSNFQIKKNNSVTFTGFSISPKKDYVILFAEQNGSIDDYELILIDLNTFQLIPSHIMASADGKDVRVRWISNSAFYFTQAQNKVRSTIDLTGSLTPVPTNGVIYSGTYPRVFACGPEGGQVLITTGTETVRVPLEIASCEWDSMLDLSDQYLNLLVHEPGHEEHLKIVHYDFSQNKSSVSGVVMAELNNQVYDTFTVFDSKYFIQTHFGKTQSLFTIDSATGQILDQLVLPDYASIESVVSSAKNKSITLTLETTISRDRDFIYDYTTHAWAVEPTRELLLMDAVDKTPFTSEIFEAPSEDGTLIPFRLTYLKSTTLNENTPFLFKVYGGYDASGGFYPEFGFLARNLFIKKGGVLVTAALRGGNEFGTTWHTQASVLNRMTTFKDLISIANYVVNQKWTSKNKIIVTGTSAGGLVTLASGLLSPESFGLLIPVSAPTDIIGKIRLDARFYELQKSEYGDPASPDVLAYMKKYSPLEQEFNPDNLPQILMVAGINDSRVNSEHTFKMIEKFRENHVSPDKLNVLLLNNSGHWLADVGFQDLIAWRENSVVWNRIYKFLGWEP